MSRPQLFLRRLIPTAVLLSILYAMVCLPWYPGAYAAIAGTGKQLLVLTLVVVVVGPGLSALVFRPGKKHLLLDLVLLAAMEAAALLAATVVLYVRQPYFAVFAVDRFEAIAAAEVDHGAFPPGLLTTRPGHAPRLVYAKLPDDPEIMNRLIDETVFEGKLDIDRRPEFWQPYAAGVAVVKNTAHPLAGLLQAGDHRARIVAHWIARSPFDAGELLYLPLRGRVGDAMMVLHRDTGYPVATLNVDPW